MMVISGELTFKNELNKDVNIKSLVFTDDLCKLGFVEFEVIDDIEKILDDLHKLCKSTKNTMSGKIIVRKSDGKFGYYKVMTTKHNYEDADVKITLAKQKTTKKPLSFDEKIELLKLFYQENERAPEMKDVYKSFNVGKFYIDCLTKKKECELVEAVVKVT